MVFAQTDDAELEAEEQAVEEEAANLGTKVVATVSSNGNGAQITTVAACNAKYNDDRIKKQLFVASTAQCQTGKSEAERETLVAAGRSSNLGTLLHDAKGRGEAAQRNILAANKMANNEKTQRQTEQETCANRKRELQERLAASLDSLNSATELATVTVEGAQARAETQAMQDMFALLQSNADALTQARNGVTQNTALSVKVATLQADEAVAAVVNATSISLASIHDQMTAEVALNKKRVTDFAKASQQDIEASVQTANRRRDEALEDLKTAKITLQQRQKALFDEQTGNAQAVEKGQYYKQWTEVKLASALAAVKRAADAAKVVAQQLGTRLSNKQNPVQKI